MASCAKCGAQIYGRFCGVCGAKNDDAEVPAPPRPPAGGLKQTVVVSPASPLRPPEPAPAPAPPVPQRPVAPAPVPVAPTPAPAPREQPLEEAEPLVRAEDDEALLSELEEPVDEGARVSPGEDDLFVGWVDDAVAFLLLGERRLVPERCRGAFLARAPRLVPVQCEVGAFTDAEQREARVALSGSLAVQVLDPFGFLASEAPKATGELAELVLDNCVAELRARIESSIADGSIAIPQLGEGMRGASLETVLSEILDGLDLVRTYGVNAWFEDTAVTADVDEGTQLERTGDEDELIEAYLDPVEAGAAVVVHEGEVFLGVADGQALPPLGVGRHRLAASIERGFFVRRAPTQLRMGGGLGVLDDATGARGEVRVTAIASISVADVAAFGAALAALTEEERADVASAIRSRVLAAVGARIREALSAGALQLASLVDAPSVIAEHGVDTRELPGTLVDFDELELIAALAPVSSAPVEPPTVARAPTPDFAAGTNVLVAWPDGNRYPGVVQQVEQGQAYVVFPNGQQGWLPFDRLTRA